MIVKIGDKQKHLPVAEGYAQVTSGRCQKGDMFANVSNPNSPFWSHASEGDYGMEFSTFECLIRPFKKV